MISLLSDFLLFLLLTYRFSAMFGGLFIYYGILQAVILFSVSKLLPVFHGIQQSKTAYGIKDTIKRSRTKNCPTHPTWCFWFVYVRNISYIFVHSCWEASCSVDQWDCEFRRVTEMAPYSIDPNSWMAAGVDVGVTGGEGLAPSLRSRPHDFLEHFELVPQFQEAFQTNPRKSLHIPYHYSENTACFYPIHWGFRESLQELFLFLRERVD